MTMDLERNESLLEKIKDNDPLLIAQAANGKIELPIDYPEEEDSDFLKKVINDITSFQQIHRDYEQELQIKSDASDAVIQLVT